MESVRVILLAPVKSKTTGEKSPGPMASLLVANVERFIAVDVANAEPVGTEDEPNVPLCAYILAVISPVGDSTLQSHNFTLSRVPPSPVND